MALSTAILALRTEMTVLAQLCRVYEPAFLCIELVGCVPYLQYFILVFSTMTRKSGNQEM